MKWGQRGLDRAGLEGYLASYERNKIKAKGKEMYQKMTKNVSLVNQKASIFFSDSNYCQDSPCQNGGVCLNIINDYTCKCRSNHKGKDCDIDSKKESIPSKRSFSDVVKELGGQNALDEYKTKLADIMNVMKSTQFSISAGTGNTTGVTAIGMHAVSVITNGYDMVKNIADLIKKDIEHQK